MRMETIWGHSGGVDKHIDEVGERVNKKYGRILKANKGRRWDQFRNNGERV